MSVTRTMLKRSRGLLRDLATGVVTSDAGWNFLRRTPARKWPFVVRTRGAYEARKHLDAVTEQALSKVAAGLTVLSGPFTGMRYPAAISVGSRLFPKLLGTYENELHTIVEQACDATYETVHDIGCAEGYYAVGCALRMPAAQIYAYDINPKAIKACSALALHNGVQCRIHIGGACTPESLQALEGKPRSLIISDCEGYEDQLFTEDVIKSLRSHDCLIETHDFFGLPILDRLLARFGATHECSVVTSTSADVKLDGIPSRLLEGFSKDDRRLLVSEGRPGPMTWLFAASRDR